MKLTPMGLILAAALVGCAGVQEGSFSAGTGLLGDGTGYQPLVMYTMPTSTCHPPSFVAGFKEAYVLSWNQLVNTKIDQYTVELSKQGANADAQKNLALYQARVIGAKPGASRAAAAQSDRCLLQSYQNGKDAGVKESEEKWKRLAEQG